MRQSNFITKFDRLLLESASGIKKCNRMLLLQVLQSVTDFIKSTSDITKCKNYYKVKVTKLSRNILHRYIMAIKELL